MSNREGSGARKSGANAKGGTGAKGKGATGARGKGQASVGGQGPVGAMRWLIIAVIVVVVAALIYFVGRGFGLFGSSQGGAGGSGPLAGASTVPSSSTCTGYKTYGVPNVPALDNSKTYQAVVDTNKGTFTIALDARQAPTTVQSFIFLAQHHYFDGVKFHRVIPGFMIQGGDPTGTGGCGPGYQFKDENVHGGYTRGTVAMANAGPGTNGSQFFVVLKDTALPPSYSVFGHVTSGMSAVDAIATVPLGTNAQGEKSVPLVKVYMKSVTIKES